MGALALLAAVSPLQAQDYPGDTWPTSSPEAEGIDPAAIEGLVADIESGVYGPVDAFLLIRHGKVVADHRWEHDYWPVLRAQPDTVDHMYNYDHPNWHPYLGDSELHSLQSVTKSVTSAALGIAIDEGFIDGVQVPAYGWFTAYEPYPSDARKAATTLEDFLTMRSGIEWNTDGGYDAETHSTILLEGSDAWIRFVLDQPTDAEPGTVYEYNDGVSVLLGKILREATGRRIDDWAREKLFEPIGIDEFYWKITPDGEADTEGGLYLTTHDLARIGYLFLHDGRWDGRQVVSESWVRRSTSPVVADVTGGDGGPGYGYQWWIPVHSEGETEVYAGNGYGGQFLFVVPEHDLVAVFNGWNIHGEGERSTYGAVQSRILPALRR